MKKNYYALVASMPDVAADDAKPALSVAVFKEEYLPRLSAKDRNQQQQGSDQNDIFSSQQHNLPYNSGSIQRCSDHRIKIGSSIPPQVSRHIGRYASGVFRSATSRSVNGRSSSSA